MVALFYVQLFAHHDTANLLLTLRILLLCNTKVQIMSVLISHPTIPLQRCSFRFSLELRNSEHR